VISDSEIKALKFYTGDVSGSDRFWGDPKAYLVLNSLFFTGISTECARASERKYLNPEILADSERLCGLMNCIFSAFDKCTAEKSVISFRVERFSDYVPIRESKRTVSFTSTSTSGFLDSYRDRKGIVLIEFGIPEGTHCIDMGKVLDVYSKSDEAEILLPPFLQTSYFKEYEVPEIYTNITDSESNPPVLYAEALARDYTSYRMKSEGDGNKAGQRVLESLNSGRVPESRDIEIYCNWKGSLFVPKT